MHANEEIDKATENRLLGIESIAYLSSQNKLGRTIPTGCKIMNEFLSGGVQTGILTEIYGEAGTGKTQLSVQIMLESLFDYKSKDLDGKCIYISTSKHLHELKYEALIQAFLKRHQLSNQLDVRPFILNYHTLDFKTFQRVIDCEIPKYTSSGTKINVIVIDNIASLASEIVENNDVKNLFERGIFLKQLSTSLKTMAYKYDIAVIIINNVIASFSDEYKKSKQVIPSLGQLWSNFLNERFKLHKFPDNIKKMTDSQKEPTISPVARSLKVKLSSRIQRKELFYLIDKDGIKGITANI